MMAYRLTAVALGAAAMIASAGSAMAVTTFATTIDAGRSGVAGVGYEATAQSFSTNRNDPGNALGAPDQVGDAEGGFYSLGRGGAAVFGFGSTFDFSANVFEVTFGCEGPGAGASTCSNFVETADVYALSGAYSPFDGAFGVADLTSLGFVQVGSIGNGDANAPQGASVLISGPFNFLALVDTSRQGADGFDVDAVSVSAVPLPASLLLLLSAIGGMGFLRARRAA